MIANNQTERAFHAVERVEEEAARDSRGVVRFAREIAVDGFRWSVAHVRAGAEFTVADALTEAGFCGYAPLGVRICQQGKTGQKKGRVARAYAVVPGYVFVGGEGAAFVTRRAHADVIAVLPGPGAASWAIADLNRRERRGEWDERAELRRLRRRPLSVGEKVLTDVMGETVEAVVEELSRAGVRIAVSGWRLPLTVGVDRLQRFGV